MYSWHIHHIRRRLHLYDSPGFHFNHNRRSLVWCVCVFFPFIVSFATIALMFNTELLRQIPKFGEKKLTRIFMCVRTLDIGYK